VRRCDDQGKVAGLATPGLEDYRGWIEELAAAGAPPRPRVANSSKPA
jgi:hypothetical protein